MSTACLFSIAVNAGRGRDPHLFPLKDRTVQLRHVVTECDETSFGLSRLRDPGLGDAVGRPVVNDVEDAEAILDSTLR